MTRESMIKVLRYKAEHIKTRIKPEFFLEVADALEQQPEDAISRQAAIDALSHMCSEDENGITVSRANVNSMLRVLSPVTPQPKTGRWITQWNVAHQKEYYYCSECREEFSYDGETGIKMNDYDYCPYCGARMIESQESEG